MSRSSRSNINTFEQSLLLAYGPLVGGATLARVLAFPSPEAFRQAVARGRIPVRIFELKGRRGRFAFSRDIAAWLAQTNLTGQHLSPSAPEIQEEEADMTT